MLGHTRQAVMAIGITLASHKEGVSMRLALRVVWSALRDYYEEMYILAGANIVWFLLCLPIVTIPPATAGMLYLTNQVAHHKTVEFSMFFQGFKKFFWKSWLLALINIMVAILFYSNYTFYGRYNAQWAAIVRGLFVGLAALWLLIQMYVFPMLLEQEKPRLLLALRNAAYMTFASPIISLVIGICAVVLMAISVGLALPLALAMMAVIGLVGNHAVLALLLHFGIRKPPAEVPAE
jgi:uncharacterized membrane protein YesL